ncbi:coproporphyrinogen-III oxidase family protein [Wukongibacter baidiensis]|uniref:coproporphyrinogen-III oxidase family protein n=1 Tax=Wukongibacter baidiensis TaxID=1723361 RepID=UPI003D7FC8E9
MITDLLRRTILGKKDRFTFKSYEEGLIDFNDINSGIGVYIHIPFCKSICPYCPYNKIVYKREKAESYKYGLIKELTLYKEKLGNKKISSIYIGGGTPTLLISELKEVIEFIEVNYEFKGDIGIEIHPNEVTDILLSKLREMNINLISLGVQTFNEEKLRFLGRGYGEDEIDRALSLIKKYNFKCVDVDIMTNIPGQSIDDIRYDLEKVYSYEIDQLSIYPLIVFPLTKLSRVIKEKKLSRFNELEERKILNLIDEISKSHGYERSSIWTYGKNHGNRYTSVTRESFIGFGAGASSHFGNYFYLNTFNVDEYIKALNDNRLPINIVNLMTEREKMIFWIFWRCYDGAIDEERFKALFHKDMKKEFRLLFNSLKLLGMTMKQGNNLVLTDLGRFAYHFVEKQYSIHYLNNVWQRSMGEPWIQSLRI